MNVRRKTIDALFAHEREYRMQRMAAFGPPPPGEDDMGGGLQPPPPPPGGGGSKPPNVTNAKRQLPEDYEFDPKALKPLAKMLWSMSVALGHALTAHREFTRLKSATISPDGMLGGRGYVMGVKDVRKILYDACENLSALSDTVHDEINAPHWKPRLAMLEKKDVDTIESLMGDADRMLENPEEDGEEDLEETIQHGHAPWHHPAVDKKNKSKKDPKSDVPDGGDAETVPSQGHHPASPGHPYNRQIKQAAVGEDAFTRMALDLYGNSSVNPDSLGGPRVKHLDRADSDQTGPYGAVNKDDITHPAEEWSEERVENNYDYETPWSNDMHEKMAENILALRMLVGVAAVPDGDMDPTPTKAFDFGIGDGNGNDAHGQAAGGYGEGNPGAPDTNPGGGTGNMGVYGPEAELPHDPGGQVNPSDSDDTAVIENEVAGKGRFAFWSLNGRPVLAAGELPNDDDEPVARSDYYDGPKGNDMDSAGSNVGSVQQPVADHPGDVGLANSGLPNSSPESLRAPLTERPAHKDEHMFAESDLPGDGTNVNYDYNIDMGPDGTNRVEQPNVPYIKWDDNTHEMQPDQNNDPGTSPYVHDNL